MIEKLNYNSTKDFHIPPDLINPFVHHLELSTTYDKIKTGVLTVIVLPLRIAAIIYLLVIAWSLACIGLMGLSEEDLRRKPLSGWRRKLTPIICALGKGTYQAGGMNITVKGRQVTRKEAPILVVAPHSTFLDASITYVTGFPSIIVRRESGLNPFIGKLINYTQPVYVWREDPNSRQNTIKEIIERVNSDLDWPQVLIFPEGTCTNRSCLITFKPGAFYPGVPVQPVCIRYPNKLDTVTWTWEGPGALKLLWLTLTQVQSSCEIEFLPVYTPSTAEKEDPKLYANNVRQLMAKALGIPVSDYTYDDCRLMTRAKQMNLPCAPCLVEVHRLRTKLGLTQKTIEEDLAKTPQLATICEGGISYQQFAHILGVCPKEEALQHLFKIYDKESNNSMDFREYLLGVLAISRVNNASEMLQLAFELFDSNRKGEMTLPDATQALLHSTSMSPEDVHSMFTKIDTNLRGYITFDEFKLYAQHKPELSHLFPSNDLEKKTI